MRFIAWNAAGSATSLRQYTSRMAAPLGRIVTAMITPFSPDGALDLVTARRLARHLVGHGSEGLVIAGTTGEGPTVTDQERIALVEAIVDEVDRHVPVIATTGTYDTRHSVHLTRDALAVGADGFLVVTPYYSKPPAEGIYQHFRAIAAAAGDRPIVAYNIPQRVVLNLEPDLLFRLAEIDNVIAVKQATTSIEQARRIVEDGRLALYAGNDDLLVPFGEIGGVGGICVASHVAGEEMLELVQACDAGETARAREIDQHLTPLYDALSVTTNPIPVKAAVEMLGFPVGAPRLPLVAVTAAERAVIRAALERRGLLATA
jgi:4-hydroxy-tetrahydrodipicolinate synthase